MLIIKRSVAIIAILFSPLSTASNLTSQLHNFFSAQLAGVSDEVRVSIRTAPNLLPPCEQPLLSMSNNSRLWGNVRCGNDKRYLQVNVQATGNYVVAAMPIARGGKLEAGNVKLKRGRLDTLPPRTVLDINQLVDAISLRDLSPDQPIQLTQFRQAWRVKAGQRVNVIASGDGFSAN
ncbi:flagellar basal body P-ring formation chaperone FlgA, partial [Escherichia coli]